MEVQFLWQKNWAGLPNLKRSSLKKAGAVVLEPVMRMEVVTPGQFLGDIIGDLSSRRGQVEAIETCGDTMTIRCLVPLARTFGYATALRSLTQGRATYSMEFCRYQELPAELVEKNEERIAD